jgi:hypothetical protein
VAPSPHSALRKSFQLIVPTEPASLAVLYFSLHCFIVSALAGCTIAKVASAATLANIPWAVSTLRPRSLLEKHEH